MLHPYSIFFKAMWEDPHRHGRPAQAEPLPRRAPRFAWLLWWRYAAQRRAAGVQRADDDKTTVPTTPAVKAGRGGIAT